MKRILITMFIIIMLLTTSVFAVSDVTMKIVEDNICTIELNEESLFEKRIIESNLEEHEVTLQLKVSNNSKVTIPSGEMMLVIDNSYSMNDIVEGENTRKSVVLNSAKQLIKNLLEANPTSLKIGITTFSTVAQLNTEAFVEEGTLKDAVKICDFTNDLEKLTNTISFIGGMGDRTNLDAGLQVAKSQFSEDDSNKYMIILTDGLPNLAVDYPYYATYEDITNVISYTQNTLNSLENIEVITMLTGINNEEAIYRTDGTNTYTYGQVIEKLFGTAEKPTIGKFYKINDSEIEQTITEEIYNDLLPIENKLENIVISDYIPEEIASNFKVSVDDVTATISEDQKNITWNIEEIKVGESKTLKINLVLKDDFDSTIIEKILNTNEKVDITYKDFDGIDKLKSSNVTPKLKLLLNDVTVAPEIIPNAGAPIYSIVIIVFIILLGMAILFKYKM